MKSRQMDRITDVFNIVDIHFEYVIYLRYWQKPSHELSRIFPHGLILHIEQTKWDVILLHIIHTHTHANTSIKQYGIRIKNSFQSIHLPN